MIKHIVLLEFKLDVTEQQIEKLFLVYSYLKNLDFAIAVLQNDNH